MAKSASTLVREFCEGLAGGDMQAVRPLLDEEVFYHNQPWEPMTGAQAVCDFLQPYIDGTYSRCVEMNILHHVGDERVVMNAREELWVRGDLRVMLPVAGLFLVDGGKITRWVDYWDLAAFQPMIDAINS